MKLNKGFTLIELLIVMVIVGLLVTIALPQYKTAMEKGRALEALHNAQAMSDAANVFFLKDMRHSYFVAGPSGNDEPLKAYVNQVAPSTGNKDFLMEIVVTPNKVWIKAIRSNVSDSNKYEIWFENVEGEIGDKYCKGNQRYCKAFGAVMPRSSGDGGGWSFLTRSEGSI